MDQRSARVLNRKSKMVSFRISMEDYEKLRIFCISKGQRSVSDLARMAVNVVMEKGGAPSLESRVADVEGRIHFITSELLRMSGHISESGQTAALETYA